MITQFQLFETYRPTGKRLYCIHNDKAHSESPLTSFTPGKYYELLSQPSWSTALIKRQILGNDFKVIDGYNKPRIVDFCSELDMKKFTPWIKNVIKDNYDIKLYMMYTQKILFIEENDVENFELRKAANKYNM